MICQKFAIIYSANIYLSYEINKFVCLAVRMAELYILLSSCKERFRGLELGLRPDTWAVAA